MILALEPIAGLEDPRYDGKADGEEQADHGEAGGRAHVGDVEKAPAEAADQIDHRIEQRHAPPERRQEGRSPGTQWSN